MTKSEVYSARRRFGQIGAGACAGVVTKTCVAPLERVKILMQLQALSQKAPTSGNPNVLYRSVPDALVKVTSEEGFLALYKGNWANCMRVIPNYALKFGFNDAFKDIVREEGQKNEDLSFQQLIGVGTLAGIAQILISYPLEVIRTRISLSDGYGVRYKGIIDCAVQTVRVEGFKALYKGLGPSIISGGPYVGLQMTFYDVFKRNMPRNEDGSLSTVWKLACGAGAGLSSQMIAYPGDTIRRRMQTNGMGGIERVYRNSFHCIQRIMQREGFRGFYVGASANAIRCLPGASIQFVAYDFFKKVFTGEEY